MTDSATESFTANDSKDPKLNEKQSRHSLKLKTDSATNSLTVIYSKGSYRFFHSYLYKDLKIYENQTPSQTSKIFSKLIIKTPE